MLLADVAAASQAVAAVPGRRAKTELLADCLRRADPGELPAVVSWLAGQTRQRRTGLGWASLRDFPPPAEVAQLGVTEVDRLLDQAQSLSGTGSQTARRALLEQLMSRATRPEQQLLGGLISGELRQGAQAGLALAAVAAAVPAAQIRRAVTLAGDLGAVAVAALHGAPGALSGFSLRVGQPLSPMLAASAPDLDAALARTGPAGIEWKLDGVRVQIHRDGDDVTVFTRTLDDITARLPGVIELIRSLPVRSAVLDGELIALRPDARPLPFQVTAAQVATRSGPARAAPGAQVRAGQPAGRPAAAGRG
jgi:DNA ligase-1